MYISHLLYVLTSFQAMLTKQKKEKMRANMKFQIHCVVIVLRARHNVEFICDGDAIPETKPPPKEAKKVKHYLRFLCCI